MPTATSSPTTRQSAGGGSGGGGGGGAAPGPRFEVVATDSGATVVLRGSDVGDVVDARFGDRLAGDGLRVDEVTIDLLFGVSDGRLRVTTPSGVAPPDVPPPPTDATVGYFRTERLNFPGSHVRRVTFQFTVDTDALPEGTAPGDVVVYRYHGGSWTTLDPQHLGNGTYRVTAPGFSTYAVGGPQPSPPAGEPSFAVSPFELSKRTVAPDQRVVVEGTVRNEGSATGSHTVNLSVDGRTWRATSVTLDPNETATVRFVVAFERPGTYTLAVDGNAVSTVNVVGTSATPEPTRTEVPELEGAGLPVPSILMATALALALSAVGVYYRYYVE